MAMAGRSQTIQRHNIMTAQHLGVTAQPMWLDEAWRLHGIHERRGRVDHPEIMSLYHEIGHPGIAHDRRRGVQLLSELASSVRDG